MVFIILLLQSYGESVRLLRIQYWQELQYSNHHKKQQILSDGHSESLGLRKKTDGRRTCFGKTSQLPPVHIHDIPGVKPRSECSRCNAHAW